MNETIANATQRTDHIEGCDVNGNVISLSLQTIANWQLAPQSDNSNIYAEIPAFQRGLVWNSAQIEVLWDSLLRGIPIGAISLIPMEGAERYSHKGNCANKNRGYFILDGQQRCNAITLGFREFSGCDRNPILWIDLHPTDELQKRSNRRYFFYVTTPARPWGYSISDSNGENKAGKIPPNLYRAAFMAVGFDSKSGLKPAVEDLWPVEARLPIPFSVFRDFVKSGKNFFDYISCNEARFHGVGWYENFKRKQESLPKESLFALDARITNVKEAYNKALGMPIMALVAPSTLASEPTPLSENGTEEVDDSEIAVYFARLNKGGTSPSQEDLNYSILKSINPSLGNIEKYKSFEDGCLPMHPSRMAHIAMLAYKSKERIARSITRRDAYFLGRDPDFMNFVCGVNGEESRFEKALVQIDRWLLKSDDFKEGLLPVMRTGIARSSVNLYLFLVLLAWKVGGTMSTFRQDRIVALVSLLAWFGDDNTLAYNDLYYNLRCKDDDIEVTIKKWLFAQIEKNALQIPPPMSVVEDLIKSVSLPNGSSGDMDAVRKAWNPIPYENALNKMWYWNGETGRSIALYACREYMNRTFGKYDPANVVWNEDSRPWDYDHIVPSKWLISGQGRCQGKWHELVSEFLNSIGNIAPIPFSMNRSKQDAPPGEYLGVDNRLIHIAVEYTDLSFFKENPSTALENEECSAFAFAKAAATRMKRLYGEWYRLPCADWLDFSSVCNDRTRMVNQVRDILTSCNRECRVVYEVSDGRQFDIEEKWDIARWHLACGTVVSCTQDNGNGNIPVEEKCFACILEQEGRFHVGIRRHPEAKQLFGRTDALWMDSRHDEYGSLQDAINGFKQILDNLGLWPPSSPTATSTPLSSAALCRR